MFSVFTASPSVRPGKSVFTGVHGFCPAEGCSVACSAGRCTCKPCSCEACRQRSTKARTAHVPGLATVAPERQLSLDLDPSRAILRERDRRLGERWEDE